MCKAAKRSKKTRCHPTSHQKSVQSPQHQHPAMSSFRAAEMGIAPSTVQGVRSRAADAVCPKSARSVLPSVCLTMRTRRAGRIKCVKQWLVF